MKRVIATFKDAETERLYHRQRSSKLPSDIQQVTLRKLRMLNNAADLRPRRATGKPS